FTTRTVNWASGVCLGSTPAKTVTESFFNFRVPSGDTPNNVSGAAMVRPSIVNCRTLKLTVPPSGFETTTVPTTESAGAFAFTFRVLVTIVGTTSVTLMTRVTVV